MTDRPILFSAPMVQALLARRKTQTRRMLPHPEYYGCPTGDCHHDRQEQCDQAMVENTAGDLRFAVGDRLWVRETWRIAPDACEGWSPEDDAPCTGWVDYRAGGDAEMQAPSFSHLLDAFGKKVDVDWDCLPDTWRPSIFMPRWASRLTLIVTDVRVQRLQDCNEADAIAEGIEADSDGWRDYLMPSTQCCMTAQDSYATLWDSINGPGAWEANPWVVAVSFDVQHGNIDAPTRLSQGQAS